MNTKLVAVSVALVAGIAQAQGMTQEQQQLGVQVITKLLAVDPLDTSLFAPEFLQAVPAEQLGQMFTGWRGQLGAFQSVQSSATGWTMEFAGGSLPVLGL